MTGKLYLKIIESSYNQKEGEIKVVDQTVFRIGREKDNDWIIDCPNRVISRHHCFIEFINNSYIINDLSKNGVFINNSRLSIGAGNCSILNDGDTLILPGLKLSVNFSEQDATASNDKFLALLPARQNQLSKQDNGIDELIKKNVENKNNRISSVASLRNQISYIQNSIENTSKIRNHPSILEDDFLVKRPNNINYDRVPAEKAAFRSSLPRAVVIPEDWNKHGEKSDLEDAEEISINKNMGIAPIVQTRLLLPLLHHFEKLEQALQKSNGKRFVDVVSESDLSNINDKNIDTILKHIESIFSQVIEVMKASHDRIQEQNNVENYISSESQRSSAATKQIKSIDQNKNYVESLIKDDVDEL